MVARRNNSWDAVDGVEGLVTNKADLRVLHENRLDDSFNLLE